MNHLAYAAISAISSSRKSAAVYKVNSVGLLMIQFSEVDNAPMLLLGISYN
ncbi:hypothetical protein [Legionella micdadei]|uniref:Uncharacterized protein n=1 Tax=Legionella micdadei TaxID=451 RepID=A0A098GHQ7_LEGMI|nr:hypothetical protein [Legionella micdadei]KTD26795.1 hypothetical protein Lmic_2889 [Legionella micdadei]NSL18294.1 hypothetical protein [Legionella micdadei]CEG61507.1 exported protein of unknown function [Legionella micdadei]SCY44559.1 hypothetical protein SAMN02982997_01714 [Legionella micdadei]